MDMAESSVAEEATVAAAPKEGYLARVKLGETVLLGGKGEQTKTMEGLRRKRALQAKQDQVREAHNQRLEAAKARSDGYWCPVPGCYRFFQSEFWLIMHRDFPGQCPDAGRGGLLL